MILINFSFLSTSIPLILHLLLINNYHAVEASVECIYDFECEAMLRKGSVCGENGLCTNPFHNGGCLKNYLPDWKRTRVCHSEDQPEAMKNGECLPPPFDYMEIRISSENWESVFFQAWIMQIMLTEMLDVPATIETGLPGIKHNFYDLHPSINSPADYGVSSDWDALLLAADVGDCRKLKVENSNGNANAYQSCQHVIPENWNYNLADVVDIREKDYIEQPKEMGALGEQHWFVPKFTAEKNPSILSYTGLEGKANRRKLAKMFKRPTTWKDYCDIVSKNNCETEDGVAVRAPINEKEENSMFVQGLYTGHFRDTKQNDCNANPNTCTGHIADWPCSWLSFVAPLTHHLDIALKSNGPEANGGYTYGQLIQIWAAANATKSNVMMEWWSPDALYQQYMGTDAEFTKVVLPPPSQTCTDNRILRENRCGDDIELRVGKPEGACDYSPKALTKLVSRSLYDNTFGSDIPEALQSPGYDAIENFRISDLQLSKILDDWLSHETDMYSFGLRDATCRWVVDNIDLVESFLPRSYPRVIEEESLAEPVFQAASILSGISIFVILASGVSLHIKRNQRVIQLAQREYLGLILLGLFLISLGALLLALPPTDSKCVGSIWLINLGYTIELVTVVTKVAAIHRLVAAGKGMQHLLLDRKKLFFMVLTFASIISAILFAWTVLDTPYRETDYQLNEEVTSNKEAIVTAISFCGSGSEYWTIFSNAWHGALLLSGTVLVILASSNREDMNDSRSHSMLIYSLFFFFGLRIMLLLVNSNVHQSHFMGYQSLIYSFECIIAIIVYFVPKFLEQSAIDDKAEQLPDLFLRTTIMFADVVGFTAWSSMQDPAQVFRFLETIYGAFDEIAERRKVFKIETVGDCYVAATGLPKPRSDHATVMVKFASDCLEKMSQLTKDLDVIYGPDTGDLSLRIGIHSGPVTGGYLRGKGARFQLFGDTMNTTSRIESSGERGRIHLSEATAGLLIDAGRGKWVRKREGKVHTKGKGELQTYWLDMPSRNNSETSATNVFTNTSFDELSTDYKINSKIQDKEKNRTSRLIDFNVEILLRLLKQIVANRRDSGSSKTSWQFDLHNISEEMQGIPLDEVKEIITLPKFNRKAAKRQKDIDAVEIPSIVVDQLKEYVTCIANRYPNNAFHNFDHASHVVTSVTKHMNRIVAPSDIDLAGNDEKKYRKSASAATLHDHTYGITSDALTQFACVYSALIHDVEHPGVPNPRLVVENNTLKEKYRGRSVAEQNSFDIAWDLLMKPQFRDLLVTVCHNSRELSRFRQLVINSVMATDLGDADLKALRNCRWDKAFHSKQLMTSSEENSRDDVNRKATIVIEHLIQASDVSHTMQHWHVYRKWNQKLFQEIYSAYCQGRAERNPADYWYEGELGFFDFYIIPLAKKLDECGVFGVSSDENLNYATQNRAEWEEKGHEVVAEMLRMAENRNLDMSLNCSSHSIFSDFPCETEDMESTFS